MLSFIEGRQLKKKPLVLIFHRTFATYVSCLKQMTSIRYYDAEISMHLQVSRSIGDAYLKRPEFNREPLLPKFRVPGTFQKPILLAEPSIVVQKLLPEDQFLIFASDGLWEHLSNQEAVDIVSSCEHHVSLFSFVLDKEESAWLSHLLLFSCHYVILIFNKREHFLLFM